MFNLLRSPFYAPPVIDTPAEAARRRIFETARRQVEARRFQDWGFPTAAAPWDRPENARHE